MMLSHKKLIIISGSIWFVIGVYLLRLGMNLLHAGITDPSTGSYPLLENLKPYLGSVENVAMLLVVFALFIGYLKGRYVLGKSAQRGVERIRTFSDPTSITNIYSAKYYILLGGMVALGITIKYMGLNGDVRGVIDMIIGSALINGAMIYFKFAQTLKNQGTAAS